MTTPTAGRSGPVRLAFGTTGGFEQAMKINQLLSLVMSNTDNTTTATTNNYLQEICFILN